ncbi:hypothetical protein DFJ77DRAFT_502793 [Powellomyces hirtus]|nr:hypothetical protein DFJ77DRAFT_502793 [Powellomyces hirtus]
MSFAGFTRLLPTARLSQGPRRFSSIVSSCPSRTLQTVPTRSTTQILQLLLPSSGAFLPLPSRHFPRRRIHATTLKPETLAPNQHKLVAVVLLTGAIVIIGDIVYFTYYHEPVAATLTPEDFKKFKLTEVIPLTHDTSLLRFAANLPQADSPAGMPVPSHVVVKDHTCQVARAYSPVTYARGHFDLLVKKYENGSVSRFLHDTPVGEFVEMRGPVVTLPYEPNAVANIGMIAGGTGITPLYQLIKRILRDPEDKTRVSLIFGTRSPADVLLFNELQIMASAKPDRLRVFLTVDSPADPRPNVGKWTGGVGVIDRTMLKQHMPPPALGMDAAILVCGPDGLIRHVAGAKPNETDQGPLGGLLKELGYQDRQVFKF